MSDKELQLRLIYSIIVAGKSARFADKAIWKLWGELFRKAGCPDTATAFEVIRILSLDEIRSCCVAARTGNYGKLSQALFEVCRAGLDLNACAPADLEKIHGIGPKTARFFIMWIRPHESYAALDVHVLRWLRSIGHPAPKSTPSGQKYAALEAVFIAEASKRGKTPRELDLEIWETASNGRGVAEIN